MLRALPKGRMITSSHMKFEENDSSPNGLLANFNGIRITKRRKYMFSATGTHQLLTLVSQLDQFNHTIFIIKGQNQ
jgi:hypothetical protein